MKQITFSEFLGQGSQAPAPVASRKPSPVPGAGDPEFQLPQAQQPAAPRTMSFTDFLSEGTETVPAGTVTRRPVTAFGYELDEGLDPVVQPVMDYSIGFNNMLADVAGVAVSDVDSILRDMLPDGFLDRPGDGSEYLQKKMAKLGIPADRQKAVSALWSDIGGATANGLLMLGGLFAAAPKMALATGESVSAILQRTIGQGLQKSPTTAITAELGAAPGGIVGQQLGEASGLPGGGPMGAAVGSALGGGITGSERLLDVAGQALKSGAKGTAVGAIPGALMTSPESAVLGAALGGGAGAARGAVRGMGGGPQAARLAAEAIPSTPIVQPPTNTARVGQFATEQVQGDITRVNNSIDAVVRGVRNDRDPLRASERLRSGLKRAYKVAQQKANIYWNKVDQSRPIDTTSLKTFTDDMVDNAAAISADKDLPGDIISRIRSLADPEVNKLTGLPVANTTLKDYRALNGLIAAELREPIKNTTLRRNLNLLHDRVLKEMDTAYPDDPTLNQANKYTAWLHTQFDRGPVGALLQRQKGGPAMDETLGDLSDPGRAIDALIRREKGGQQIAAIASDLDMSSLVQRSAATLQEQFGQIAAEIGPEAGAKFLNRREVQRFQKAFPEVDANLTATSTRLNDLLDERKTIQNSAFARFANEDPQKAISGLMISSNKVSKAKEVVGKLQGDPDALEAFRAGIMDELWRNGATTPSRVQARLAAQDMQPMLAEIFTPQQLNRINANVKNAVYLETAGEGRARAIGGRGATLMARIVGAAGGRALSRFTGGGTIQIPGILANSAGKMMDNFLATIPPEKLLAQAMLDPKMERLLWTKVPQNLKDATALTSQLRTAITSLEGANQAFGQMRETDNE